MKRKRKTKRKVRTTNKRRKKEERQSAIVLAAGQEDLFEDADEEVRAILTKARKRSKTEQKRRKPSNGPVEVVGVLTEKVSAERHREAGPVHTGYQFWRRLGLEDILVAKKLSSRSR